jgi:hypothetical protein
MEKNHQVSINLVTSATGERAFEPIKTDEREFWRNYLRALNARNSYVLNDNFLLNFFEIELLSFILSGDPDKSYFKGELAKQVKDKFNISAPLLSNMKKDLVMKDFLEETGVVRGDALLHRNIRKLQKFVKENKDKSFNFVFSYKMV